MQMWATVTYRRCTFLNVQGEPGNSIGAWQERTDTWEEDLKKLKEVMEKAQLWCELDKKRITDLLNVIPRKMQNSETNGSEKEFMNRKMMNAMF